MAVRLLFIFILLLTGCNSKTEEKFDVNNHDAFTTMKLPVYLGRDYMIENKGLVKDWVEIDIDIDISEEKKTLSFEIVRSSNNDIFNQKTLKHIQNHHYENNLRPKMDNGNPVSSIYRYRYDLYFNGLDDYEGVIILGKPKLLKSNIKKEDIQSQRMTLIYFQHEVPENSFEASQTVHHDGDFIAIKVKKNLMVWGTYQTPYAKDFSFNTLKNKKLMSYFEFYEANTAYTNWPSQLIRDKDGNEINPESFNEHKPIAEKTEYWSTRPKSAKPQFPEGKYLFGDYYAELDQINFEGVLKLQAHVEPTGLLQNIKILEGSGIERVDEITLKVLHRMYIIPAYQDYQNVADDIEFEISFAR